MKISPDCSPFFMNLYKYALYIPKWYAGPIIVALIKITYKKLAANKLNIAIVFIIIKRR